MPKKTINSKQNKIPEKKENTKPKISKLGFFRMISVYYRQFWLSWLLLVSFTIVTCAITVAIPKLTNIIFNELTTNATSGKFPVLPWNVLIYWAIGFGVAFIISGVFMYCQSLVGGRIARKIEIEIRIKVLNKLIDLDLSYYHDKKMGDILTKLISDTQILGDQTYQIPLNFLNAVFVFIGSIAILFTLDNNVTQTAGVNINNRNAELELAGIVLGCSFAIMILTVFLFSFFRKLVYKQRKVVSGINGDVSDRINAIRLIKTTGTIDYEKNRFIQIHKKYYKVSMKAIKVQSLIMAVVITTLTSMNILALIVSIVFVNEQRLNPIIMISFTMSINSLILPILQLVRMLANLASASTSASRVSEILNQSPKIDPHLDSQPINLVNGQIKFENVSFRYREDSDYVLKNFNFNFEKGKSYAIVGETGVGKSTIAHLLLRTYDPVEGFIKINENLNLNEINLKSYLDHVGYVEQEPQIIYGSFYDNIRYGKFDATDEDVIEAAKLADLDNFISTLPDNYNTVLGERGFILSGGQKQRVVIARMFLRNPTILILDEATSALDNIVEKEIQNNLNKLMKDRTTIVIAHRLSTIKNVDQILVLEKGKGVVEVGNFQELKVKPGRFKLLYEAGLME